MSMAAALHTVRHPGLVTAAGALAWFAASGEAVIGYLLAPSRADWFRCAGGVAHGPDGPRDLRDTYELFAACETRQLRWFHQDDGRGQAICLGEDPATAVEATVIFLDDARLSAAALSGDLDAAWQQLAPVNGTPRPRTTQPQDQP